MATAFSVFDEFSNYRSQGKINLTSDSFKAMLTNVAPTKAGSQVKGDITEISAGNGYTAGGQALTGVSYAENGTGVWEFTCADFTWTASGGSFGPFRYVVIYDDTVSSPVKPLVAFLDIGSSITLTDTNSITIDVQSPGIFQDSST